MSQAPRPIADSLARLDRWLKQHRPRYHRALLPGATAAEIEAAEKKLGRPFPADLRALLAWHNGQGRELAGAFADSWRFMGAARIVAAKLELDNDGDESGWQPDWIPFLDDDQGDYLCLDTNQTPAPVREFLDRKDHAIIAPSLAGWLDEFVTAVERGDYVEDPERGDFLRRTSS